MKQFPAFIDLRRRAVVIVGASEEAARKGRLVAEAGADLTFVAPAFEPGFIADWRDRARFHLGEPDRAVFKDAALVFIALADEADAMAIAARARRAGALVNVVDRPSLCDFITPSIVDRGDVVVAISTGGAAPVLARRVRAKIEALLPPRLSQLAAFARAFRAAAAARHSPTARRAFWERFFDGPVAARLLAGDEAGAREAMIAEINRPQTDEQQGVVHLVGAGPGDPELLTLRAHRILQDADVILYDRLVGDGVLALARRDAVKLYVGKAKADHAVPQAEIEERMIAFARAGKTVVRLKGGDPFVFGRGGEELDALRAAGVSVLVTPGVTAAIGCAAASGMALTHRDHAQAVTFVTGHAKDGGEPDHDWRSLARLNHTLVVYMGIGKAAIIGRQLIENGRSGATPVAVIENGTLPQQRVLKGRLENLGALVARGDVRGPALLVVGDVAALATGAMTAPAANDERKSA